MGGYATNINNKVYLVGTSNKLKLVNEHGTERLSYVVNLSLIDNLAYWFFVLLFWFTFLLFYCIHIWFLPRWLLNFSFQIPGIFQVSQVYIFLWLLWGNQSNLFFTSYVKNKKTRKDNKPKLSIKIYKILSSAFKS